MLKFPGETVLHGKAYVSLQVQRLIRLKEAEATAQGITWSELAAEVTPDFEDPQGLLGTPYACHTAIINYMAPTQLFERLCEVRSSHTVAPAAGQGINRHVTC